MTRLVSSSSPVFTVSATITDPAAFFFLFATSPLSSRANIFAVPKAVLDLLAEMIAADSSLNVGPFAGAPGGGHGLD
jgi:hypothetical protein